jgi:hypothetical protein
MISWKTLVCFLFNTSCISYAGIANIMTPGAPFFIPILIEGHFTSPALTNTLQARVCYINKLKIWTLKSLSLSVSHGCATKRVLLKWLFHCFVAGRFCNSAAQTYVCSDREISKSLEYDTIILNYVSCMSCSLEFMRQLLRYPLAQTLQNDACESQVSLLTFFSSLYIYVRILISICIVIRW